MLLRLTTALAAITLWASTVNASGKIVEIVDENNFCVMLPPNGETNRNIADTEWNANAFCKGNTPNAVGADTLDSGFITSAHYLANASYYVQVTGTMDYTKANLNGSDPGGQYDIKMPADSTCAGWLYYVNLIEPSSNTYCIRCCNDPKTCNRGISEKGCAHIIPGDYSGPTGTSDTAVTSISGDSTVPVVVISSTVTKTSTVTGAASTTSTNTSNSKTEGQKSNEANIGLVGQSLSAGVAQKPFIAILAGGLLFTAILLS